MKKKIYTENDEIEIKLVRSVSTLFYLKWRFKEPRRFWFFKIRDRWKPVAYYLAPSYYHPGENPEDERHWFWRSFDLGKKSDTQTYKALKEKIKTKKDLYDYYNVEANVQKYYHDLEEHKKWLEETAETIKELVK